MKTALILPPLREEIVLHGLARALDGSPRFTLADPTRNRFFQINWPTFEILSRWGEGDGVRIADRIGHETSLSVTCAEIEEVLKFLADNHLLRSAHPETTRRFHRLALAKRGHWLTWLLHHYLFFRIPLIRPDHFLNRTYPLARPLYGAFFARFMVALAAVALFLLLRRWDAFHAALLHHLESGNLLVGYGLTLIGVKSLHELGHAYTAKRYGCRVPTMGVAFLVLLPMLYTDTTEAWKLSDKRRRRMIACGGMLAEGCLAVFALLAWQFLPPGQGREMAFWIATTSLATTLAINVSPFMRFDGYFILSDWLDLPNLHERSFHVARWWLRERLFRLGAPCPEELSGRMRLFLILFALATWIYRFVLFLGIAVLVYHFFVKVIGILLFIVEIGWFIIRPVWFEILAWRRVLPVARTPWRLPLLLAGATLLLVVPWSTRVNAPALLEGAALTRLYVPHAARLERIHVSGSARVEAGEPLFVLRAPDLERQKRLTGVRMANAGWELAVAGLDTAWSRRARTAREERERFAATLTGLEAEERRLVLTAPFAGEILDLAPELTEGVWMGGGTHLATLVERRQSAVWAYLEEGDLGRVRAGARGVFVPEGVEFPGVAVRLAELEASAVAELDEPLLASLSGGPIPARLQQRSVVPEGAWFKIHLTSEADHPPYPVRLRGTVHLEAESRSPLEGWLRSALLVLVREMKM
ncbi:HlyD family efflux transporter periplasmic adaptor subunit [Candidatus Magnetaquiglobus chichijimensis]|uniref:HlyD family efflux transporter periplasmic adaptor subunit n=1 Tax=Candidatus Magnetaquiglobus chichijimensis TaxID=3141448 RepID=UPI003B97A87B